MTDNTDYCYFGSTHRRFIIDENKIRVIYDDVSCVTEDGVPIRKLFVSNLADRTTHKDLLNLFSKYGHVEKCFLRRNQGKSNYAFVTFSNVSEAKRPRYDELRLHNRNLRVTPADSWHQPDSIENEYYNIGKDWLESPKKQCDEQCNQDWIENDNTDHSIDKLNDDCLTHIFLHLPIADRVRIERVCKRWKAVSHESWHNVKKLELSHSTWGFPPASKRSEISTVILRKILLRCGRFLTEINLAQQSQQLSQSTLTIVGKLCPNLQKINVNTVYVSASSINSLTRNCHDITSFSLGLTTYTCDSDLQKLFKVNQKLRYLRLDDTTICGRCLLHLPADAVEEFILEKCTSLHQDILSQAIAKLTNLKSLSINHCFNITGNVIHSIGNYCTNLRKLELCENFSLIEPDEMLFITELANLEVLKVSLNKAVTDKFLSNLSSKCLQLSYVDICGCRLVTNTGLTAIVSLPKLRVLIMSYLYRVTNIELQNMYNLKELVCQGCEVSDQTMNTLLKCCSQLELLDLSGCFNITNGTLKAAAAATIKRENNTILKIFVGGTRVDLKKFNDISPFLQIVNVDLSRSEML